MNKSEISLNYLAEINPAVDLPFTGMVEYLPMENVHKGYFDHNVSEISLLPSSLNAFKEGDILLAKVTPCFENGNLCLAEGVANHVGLCSTELFVLRPNKERVLPDFLILLLQDEKFRQEAKAYMRGTGGLKRIPPDWLKNYKFKVPSIETQHQLVVRSKEVASRINLVVNQKKQVLNRLLDYRQSLITRAVTKGLDPNVPTKDAGLVWLGRIPEHWSYMRLAHCFTSVNRPANLDLPVLSVSIHTGISESELRDEERDRKVWLSEDRSKYQSIKEGDLVYNMMRAWQGGFGTSTRSGLVSPAYTVLSPNNGICSKYFELLFRTPNAQKMIYGYSQGIADFRKRLYWEKARDIYVPVPPYGEQLQIVNEVSKIEKRIETTKEIISKQIKLIAEYRESLISSFFASHDKS